MTPSRAAIGEISRHPIHDFWRAAITENNFFCNLNEIFVFNRKCSALGSTYRSFGNLNEKKSKDLLNLFVCILYFNSLTKQTAIIVIIGIDKQYSATLRHSVRDPIKNTRNNPSVAAMPLKAIKIPRIDA